jgi:peptidoglycan biosynthesis protein MviN/MurJ (putative lipid II flippase)
MVSCFFFLPVRGVALPILMGLGKPRTPTLVFLGAGLLNVGLSIVLARPFGLAGIAWGTAIPNVIFACVVLGLACRELGVSVSSYLGYVIPRAAVGAIPVLVLLLWFRLGLEVETLLGLAGAGTAVVALFAITWIFFVYRDDPYIDLRSHLMRRRAWNRA